MAEPEHVIPEHVIEVEGLVTTFGATTVHEGLSLRVRRGEIMAVVGGSGTGKSVLVRAITAGDVSIRTVVLSDGLGLDRIALGDPIEISSLSAVLDNGETNNRVLVGSVKTNIGHLESAAGIAGRPPHKARGKRLALALVAGRLEHRDARPPRGVPHAPAHLLDHLGAHPLVRRVEHLEEAGGRRRQQR